MPSAQALHAATPPIVSHACCLLGKSVRPPFLPFPSKPLRALALASPLFSIHKPEAPSPRLVARASGWGQQEEAEESDVDAVGEGLSDWEGNAALAEEEFEGGEFEEGGDAEEDERLVNGEGKEHYREPPGETTLFVGNIPIEMDSMSLAELFEQAGSVEMAEVKYSRGTNTNRGFGFVSMRTVQDAENAIEKFNNYDCNGWLLTVAKARGASTSERPRETGPSFEIYVGNLPWQVDNARLKQVFSEYGKVVNARVKIDRDTGRSRGFGFVAMSTQTEMDDAIAALDGQSMDGRTLRVNIAAEKRI